MERFSGSYIESLSADERQQLLLSTIPMLSGFKSKAGNEGEVFFVSKDVLVKKYFSKIDNMDMLGNIFNKYCEECEYFSKKGYNIPKIYDWTMISRPDHSGFDYYLLEQKIPGRELFLSNILKLYDSFKYDVDETEFDKTVNNPENNPKLYEKILTEYVHDFIEMNQRIESMSDAELEKFLEGIYNMFIECKYAIPDVHARNVLMYQNKLNLIDLYLERDREGYKAMKLTPPENLLLARIIALFNYNGDVKKFKSNDFQTSEINEFIDINEDLCTEAIKKVIRAGKRLCKFHPEQRWWDKFANRVEKVLNKEHTAEILKEIDPTLM